MRRHSAAVIGMVAIAMTAGISPPAFADQNGYDPDFTLFRTAGNVRCSVSNEKAACQRLSPPGFAGAPADAPVASVTRDGTFSWESGGIGGSGQEIMMVNGQPYPFHKWTMLLTTEGTRLSKVGNSHGMNISIDGTVVTPY